MVNGAFFEKVMKEAKKLARCHSDSKIVRNGSGFHVQYDFRNGSPHYGYFVSGDPNNNFDGFSGKKDNGVVVIPHS